MKTIPNEILFSRNRGLVSPEEQTILANTSIAMIGTGGDGGLLAERLVRFGIGKPPGPNAKDRVAGYVLSNFDDAERRQLDELISQAADAAETWVRDGLATAMNRFNKRAP